MQNCPYNSDPRQHDMILLIYLTSLDKKHSINFRKKLAIFYVDPDLKRMENKREHELYFYLVKSLPKN